MLFCQVLFYKNMENYLYPVKLRTQFKFFGVVSFFFFTTFQGTLLFFGKIRASCEKYHCDRHLPGKIS